MSDIVLHPEDILLQPSKIHTDTDSNIFVANELLNKMRSSSHCVGLAANQLGFDNRVCVIDGSKSRKPCVNHGELALINPKIIRKNGSQEVREGCMSVPHFTVNVNRCESLDVQAETVLGELKEYSFVGFEAVIVMHEIDHLDGYTILERANSANNVFPRKVYK